MCILLPTIGGIIASQGVVGFSPFGLLCQAGAVIVGHLQWQTLTTGGSRTYGRSSTYHPKSFPHSYEMCRDVCSRQFLPEPMETLRSRQVCAVIISAAVPIFEGSAPLKHLYKVGGPILVLDGFCAWGLNMASMGVIASVGSLALCLSGYIKVNFSSRSHFHTCIKSRHK